MTQSVCVISQPRFFPGLHYLHRMLIADVFVIFDTVQFTPRHEENRAKLKTPQGAQWLTAPMRKKSREQLILETYVDNSQPWSDRAIKTLQHLYGKAPYYNEFASEINAILERCYERLPQLDRATWEPACRLLGITCRFVYASDLPISGRGSRLLLDICQHLEAGIYLSGAFGEEYLDQAEFEEAGIAVKFHEYTYPTYSQRFGEFTPYLSYLDMLFNVGLDRELVLSSGQIR